MQECHIVIYTWPYLRGLTWCLYCRCAPHPDWWHMPVGGWFSLFPQVWSPEWDSLHWLRQPVGQLRCHTHIPWSQGPTKQHNPVTCQHNSQCVHDHCPSELHLSFSSLAVLSANQRDCYIRPGPLHPPLLPTLLLFCYRQLHHALYIWGHHSYFNLWSSRVCSRLGPCGLWFLWASDPPFCHVWLCSAACQRSGPTIDP